MGESAAPRSSRSASLTMPIMLPSSSITGMALTWALTSSDAASKTVASAEIDITLSDITSLARMASLPSGVELFQGRLVAQDDGAAGGGELDQAGTDHLG